CRCQATTAFPRLSTETLGDVSFTVLAVIVRAAVILPAALYWFSLMSWSVALKADSQATSKRPSRVIATLGCVSAFAVVATVTMPMGCSLVLYRLAKTSGLLLFVLRV